MDHFNILVRTAIRRMWVERHVKRIKMQIHAERNTSSVGKYIPWRDPRHNTTSPQVPFVIICGLTRDPFNPRGVHSRPNTGGNNNNWSLLFTVRTSGESDLITVIKNGLESELYRSSLVAGREITTSRERQPRVGPRVYDNNN